MTRLGISVKGATEREFVNRLLRPHLLEYGVAATAIDLCGPEIIELAGLDLVRAQCARFDAWLHRLEKLG